MRRRNAALTVLATAVLVGQATAALASDTFDARPRSGYEQQVEAELARHHDELRAEVGAGPLVVWTDIRTVARGWSEQQAVEHPCDDQLCHNLPPQSAIPYHREFGCHLGHGENVVYRSGTGTPPSAAVLADLVMGQWRNSAAHRDTLVHPDFDEVGYGVHLRTYTHPSYGQAWEVFATTDYRDRDPNCDPAGEAVPTDQLQPPADQPPPTGDEADAPPPGDDDQATTSTSVHPDLTRLAGEDRIATAIAAASTFASATSVILASAADYPDALAAAPLAGALDAPVLLVGRDALDPRVRGEIERLGATDVVLVGGSGALGAEVADEAGRIAGVTRIERIAGASRWETAAHIAARVIAETGSTGNVILVEGANPDPQRGWPDALASASVAARTATPVLLTLADGIPGPTVAALDDLGVQNVLVVGGQTAVSDATMHLAASIAGGGSARWSGDSRFATSIEVDRRSRLSSSAVLLATGLGWADALSAGPAAAHLDATLLLIHGQDATVAAQTRDWIREAHPNKDVLLVGGSTAISAPVASILD